MISLPSHPTTAIGEKISMVCKGYYYTVADDKSAANDVATAARVADEPVKPFCTSMLTYTSALLHWNIPKCVRLPAVGQV